MGATVYCPFSISFSDPLAAHRNSSLAQPNQQIQLATWNLSKYCLIAMHDVWSEGRYHSFRTDTTFLSASLSHSTIEHTEQSCCLECPEMMY